jgi:hypothetical protein
VHIRPHAQKRHIHRQGGGYGGGEGIDPLFRVRGIGIKRQKPSGGGAVAQQPRTQQARVGAGVIVRHPAFIAEHHIHAIPVQIDPAHQIEGRPRRSATGHHQERALPPLKRGAQIPAQPLRQRQHHHFSIDMLDQFH